MSSPRYRVVTWGPRAETMPNHRDLFLCAGCYPEGEYHFLGWSGVEVVLSPAELDELLARLGPVIMEEPEPEGSNRYFRLTGVIPAQPDDGVVFEGPVYFGPWKPPISPDDATNGTVYGRFLKGGDM